MTTPATPARFIARLVFAAVGCLCTVGCTSLQTLEPPTPTKISDELAPGDNVHLRLSSGADLHLVITQVRKDALVGRASKHGSEYAVPLDTIADIQVRRVSAVKTTGLVLGLLGVVVGVAVKDARDDGLMDGPDMSGVRCCN